MRLAIITTHPIQYYAPLFRRLTQRGRVTPHVFYGWRGGIDASYDPGFGAEVEWDIPLLEGYDYTFVANEADDPGTHHFRGMQNPDLPPAVRNWQPDAVLVFGWGWQSHLRALVRLHGTVPVLFRGDSTLIDESPGLRRMARRVFLHWVYRHVDAALPVGTRNAEYFRAHGLSRHQLFWVPHAVDNRRFDDPDGRHTADARRWRQDLGIPDDACVALYAGKFEPVKDPGFLLDAFLRLGDAPADAHLVLVGSGPLEDDLRQQAGRHPRVHFVGFQNQSRMPVVYRLGDVVVLPSRSETWGLAVNEAMACGRPVVVTDRVGCAPDLVDDTNGAVVSSGDTRGLRAALSTLLSDRSRLQQMGRRSARRIASWSIEEAARRLERAVQRVAEFSSPVFTTE